jgi:hypothetical protein
LVRDLHPIPLLTLLLPRQVYQQPHPLLVAVLNHLLQVKQLKDDRRDPRKCPRNRKSNQPFTIGTLLPLNS